MNTVIFDFDGVIHDTFEFHRKKVEEFVGIALPVEVFRDIHKGNFFTSTPKELHNVKWENYRDFIFEEQSTLEASEDVKKVIHALSDQYDLYIVTSGGEKNILGYLENNQLEAVFKGVFGLETCKTKVAKFKHLFQEYGVTADQSIFITDTLGDILEANKVELKTVAVDFGYHDKETLSLGKPYKIISSIHELLPILTPAT